MKSIKIMTVTAIAIAIFTIIPQAINAQAPTSPPQVGWNTSAPQNSVPLGTGIDLLILIGGGFVAKKIQDKRKRSRR